jgi:hypothetical protein
LPDVILTAGENPYFMPGVQRNLDDDVRRVAEADQQQPALLRHCGSLERAISDQSGAQ